MKASAFRALVIADLLNRGWTPPLPSDAIVERVLEDMQGVDPRVSLELTVPERKALEHVARGFSVATVGGSIGISPETVKRQLRDVRDKLEARNTVNAVAIAIDEGIIHSAAGWREAA